MAVPSLGFPSRSAYPENRQIRSVSFRVRSRRCSWPKPLAPTTSLYLAAYPDDGIIEHTIEVLEPPTPSTSGSPDRRHPSQVAQERRPVAPMKVHQKLLQGFHRGDLLQLRREEEPALTGVH